MIYFSISVVNLAFYSITFLKFIEFTKNDLQVFSKSNLKAGLNSLQIQETTYFSRPHLKIVFNIPKKHGKESIIQAHKYSVEKGSKLYIDELKKMLETKANLQNFLYCQTPRIFTALAIASTMPTLYYLYNILLCDYHEPQLYDNIKNGIDWMNYTNIFASGIYMGLEAVRYADRRFKVRLSGTRYTHFFVLGVMGLSLASLSFWDNCNKFIVVPNILRYSLYSILIVSDLVLLLAETKLAGEGLIPYWFFDVRYRIHIFTIINLSFYYYALKHLEEDITASPEKYQPVSKASI